MKRETEFLRSQIKESFAKQCGMNDSNQCPLCGLRTTSERSTQTHLRSDHKRKELEIAEILSRAKAGSLGCDPAAKSLRKMIKASFSTVQYGAVARRSTRLNQIRADGDDFRKCLTRKGNAHCVNQGAASLESLLASAFESQRGVLVPVANPEAVPGLLAIAFAAIELNDPPPRVLALVDRPPIASVEPQGGEKGTAPPTTALLAAVRYAHAKGVTIGAQVSWSDDPALDIITVAREGRVVWILLGYHCAASGSDMTGGVVRKVFAKAKVLPINVGVFIQGTDRPIERVFAAVDSSPDGRASLALGVRIAKRNRCRLRALLLAKRMPTEEDALLDMVRDTRADMGEEFHADVLTERSLHQLLKQAPGRLLIVGRKFADEVGFILDEVPSSHRNVILVQGGDIKPSEHAPSVDGH